MLPAPLLVVVDGNTDAEVSAICEDDVIAITGGEFSANDNRVGAILKAARCRQVILLVFDPVVQDVLVGRCDLVAFKCGYP